jgi:hypothetical protein
MTTYRFTSAAFAELREATLYYEGKESGLGGTFLDEIDAAIERILTNPHAWHPLSPERGDAGLIAFRSAFFTKFAPTRFLSQL